MTTATRRSPIITGTRAVPDAKTTVFLSGDAGSEHRTARRPGASIGQLPVVSVSLSLSGISTVVGSQYNDGFIAELDYTSWSSGLSGPSDPHITAPHDFAKDAHGNIITINSAGPEAFTKANAAGTAYGGATRILRASTPITAGTHSLFLSIFDQGDRSYDSAVFLDNLTINHRASCQSGPEVHGRFATLPTHP